MKIDLSTIDREQFILKEGMFCGIPAILVTPAMQGTNWTQSNKYLRSSIWSSQGELLSAGFPKFCNFLENPENFPVPKSLDNAICVEKIDGSLAIFDYVNGIFSCRTRGVFNISTLENAADFIHCINKYPKIKEYLYKHPNYSLLCEITTPNQKIIIDYGSEIDLTFIGLIGKSDYQLQSQVFLDLVSPVIAVKRPRYFNFSSLDHLLSDVPTWKGLEGCVLYSSAGLHKIKGEEYLRLHRFKERVSISNILDLWQIQDCPNTADFKANITRDFDFECLALAEPLAEQIGATWEMLKVKLSWIQLYVTPFRSRPRRDAALIIQKYIEKPFQGVAFNYLSNKQPDSKQIRKLMDVLLDV